MSYFEEKIKIDDPESLCVDVRACVRGCVCVCVCGTVTASEMVMHHVLIILTLTFIIGLTYLKHGSSTC